MSSSNGYVYRFAPSPTGIIHMGNARTALFNAIAAKYDNRFLLRIEDTDAERSKAHYVTHLLEDLQWLGVIIDEGVTLEGERGMQGPYRQSQRFDLYNVFYQQLIEQGKAYPCFCSQQQLEISRKSQAAAGLPPRYSGVCRQLTAEEVAEKKAAGLPYTLRFKLAQDDRMSFVDLVKGEQSFFSRDIGDFIIRRADKTASFMFANAVDDALMGVSHVLRGDDHLTNTPRQLWILDALNLSAPQYGHISMIVGQDNAPLSKRNGSESIASLREQGFLKIAVINYLMRLGHYYDNNHLMTWQQLADAFAFKHLGRSPAKHDKQQLYYWQKEAVNQLSLSEKITWLSPFLVDTLAEDKMDRFVTLVADNVVLPEDMKSWLVVLDEAFIPDWSLPLFQVCQTIEIAFFEDLLAGMVQKKPFKDILNLLKEKYQRKGVALFKPVRLAISASEKGPDLSSIANYLGDVVIKKRLLSLISYLKGL